MSEFAPPPTPIDALMMLPISDELEELERLAEQNANEIEELERLAEQNANEIAATFMPEIETIPLTDLLLLGLEPRFERIATALENVATIKAAGRNDIVGLTAQVNRLADAFEAMAGFIGCITDSVEGADGVSRCYVRTRHDNHGWLLSERDDRE
jgi:hypothetical protein